MRKLHEDTIPGHSFQEFNFAPCLPSNFEKHPRYFVVGEDIGITLTYLTAIFCDRRYCTAKSIDTNKQLELIFLYLHNTSNKVIVLTNVYCTKKIRSTDTQVLFLILPCSQQIFLDVYIPTFIKLSYLAINV